MANSVKDGVVQFMRINALDEDLIVRCRALITATPDHCYSDTFPTNAPQYRDCPMKYWRAALCASQS